VDLGGAALPPSLRLALGGYVVLGKLSPHDLRALAGELRAAGGRATDLAALLEALGPAAPGALDDPMGGVLTGPLQRALAGAGTPLLAALGHVCARPDPANVSVYFYVFVRFRRGLVALALRLARELPALPPDAVDGSVELFAWFRENRAREVSVELLDGLAGLLLNGFALDRVPRAEEVVARLVPAGGLPTRARHVRSVAIGGAPFADALGRFFAAPSRTLALARTGRSVVVWRTGSCPFALAGWSETAPEG
jgi:hypothetical protein